MSDTYQIENNAIDGEELVGSLYHSNTQIKLGGLLDQDERFFVATELSIDISQQDISRYRLDVKDELKPDICAYIEPPIVPDTEDDIIKVSKMPDLVIEILSPRQAISYLIRKIKAYFELGVKSCWLVIPSLFEVRVFSQPHSLEIFDIQRNADIIDDVMDIRLPIQKVFTRYKEYCN